MAQVSPYKQYSRQQRRASLDNDFSKGMMFTDGLVEEGYLKYIVNYTYDRDGGKLVPRPAIRPNTVIFPDMEYLFTDDYLSPSVAIKDARECIENNKTYSQFILGKLDQTSSNKGTIWAITAPASDNTVEITNDDYTYDVKYALSHNAPDNHKCYFYNVEASSIHNVPVDDDVYKRMAFPVGSFAYGNSYYFFGEDSLGNPGLYRTKFDETTLKYVFDSVAPKELSASEAVTYGYNMLAGSDAYIFRDAIGEVDSIQFEGILPYDRSTAESSAAPKILMTPKKNQPITFRCYYSAPENSTYDIVWEWRETTASDWTLLQKDANVAFAEGTVLEVLNFTPPAKDIMVRVAAYPVGEEVIEKAMTVGFDFTIENYGSATKLEQEVYDLTTATGMECWKDRLVLWGVPSDPTILFISDYQEPSYFPYPNNITVFDSPIIYAVEFMDGLAVFTTDKLYHLTLAEDGNSWKTELLQSHLNIESWDKHLIQTVRNMLFFKSGNYYYMMVPKAQSTTGELTLAPITTPITGFFDRFSVNVQTALEETYDYKDPYSLKTYYNYLDYEDIHNVYVFGFEGSESALMYVDVIYNTVDRLWKIWVYEGAHMLFPYKNNATESGLLASTSLLKLHVRSYDSDSYEYDSIRRFIQIFSLEKLIVRDYYIPQNTEITYDDDFSQAAAYEGVLTIPNEGDDLTVDDHTLNVPFRLSDGVVDHTARWSNVSDYYHGFYKSNIRKTLNDVYAHIHRYCTFMNYQFIDTGYRDDSPQLKKRYRELQIQLNNLDKKNMQFGMNYILDGATRNIYYKYDVAQAIDEFNPDYGVLYIDSTPYLETDLDDIDITNQWSLDQNIAPDITLWKIRVATSGKGYAPRLKLNSRNEHRYELLGINWIYKVMNMR